LGLGDPLNIAHTGALGPQRVNALTVQASTTELGRLFQVLTTGAEKKILS